MIYNWTRGYAVEFYTETINRIQADFESDPVNWTAYPRHSNEDIL